MFKLIVECSEYVQSITINFGDDKKSVMHVQDNTEGLFTAPEPEIVRTEKPKARDMDDIVAERAAASKKPVLAPKASGPAVPVPTIDIANRPPSVDQDFQQGY